MSLLAPTLLAVVICALLAYIPLLIWRLALKRRTGPTFGQYSGVMVALTLGLGFLGFLLGFFGPIALEPGSAQGPLLGIFISGPLGALAGVLVSWIWFYVKRTNT
jgi:hypothetical protein